MDITLYEMGTSRSLRCRWTLKEIGLEYKSIEDRSLFRSNELLGKQITSLHNIRFYLWLMEQAQEQLQAGSFNSWKNKMIKKLDSRL